MKRRLLQVAVVAVVLLAAAAAFAAYRQPALFLDFMGLRYCG